MTKLSELIEATKSLTEDERRILYESLSASDPPYWAEKSVAHGPLNKEFISAYAPNAEGISSLKKMWGTLLSRTEELNDYPVLRKVQVDLHSWIPGGDNTQLCRSLNLYISATLLGATDPYLLNGGQWGVMYHLLVAQENIQILSPYLEKKSKFW